jgi:NADPH-dependent 7-cyano-7-deazaguanine reductase QueF
MSVTATVQENLFKVESRQTVTTAAGSRCVVSEQPEFLTIAIAFVCADRAYSLEK